VDTISFDAVATVRLLGEYTLAGLNIQAPDPLSTAPKFRLGNYGSCACGVGFLLNEWVLVRP